LAKTFAVIGLGKFGGAVARLLAQQDLEVLAVDRDEAKVEEIKDYVSDALVLDATDERALRDAGLAEVDTVVVSVGGRIDASILITLALKELGVRRVITKAMDSIHGKILSRIGADRVVYPEREMAERLVQSLISPGIFDYIELSPTHSVMEIVAPKSFFGQTLKRIGLRERYGVSVIAIKRKIPVMDEAGKTDFHEEVNLSPGAEDEIQEGDVVVLLGPYEGLAKVQRL
jgi:trk system potassium uptake protein TrkA